VLPKREKILMSGNKNTVRSQYSVALGEVDRLRTIIDRDPAASARMKTISAFSGGPVSIETLYALAGEG